MTLAVDDLAHGRGGNEPGHALPKGSAEHKLALVVHLPGARVAVAEVHLTVGAGRAVVRGMNAESKLAAVGVDDAGARDGQVIRGALEAHTQQDALPGRHLRTPGGSVRRGAAAPYITVH